MYPGYYKAIDLWKMHAVSCSSVFSYLPRANQVFAVFYGISSSDLTHILGISAIGVSTIFCYITPDEVTFSINGVRRQRFEPTRAVLKADAQNIVVGKIVQA